VDVVAGKRCYAPAPVADKVAFVDARPAAILALLGLAVGGGIAAAALILLGRPLPAGVVTAVAGSALVLAGVRAAAGSPRLVFADAVAERAFDAAVLGALAWATARTDPVAVTGALTALVLSYLASYLRAKATGLGFPLAGPSFVRPVRVALLSVAVLSASALDGALWLVALVSLQAVVREAVSVARQRERR